HLCAKSVEHPAGDGWRLRQVSVQRREGRTQSTAEGAAEDAQLMLDLLNVRHLAEVEEAKVLQRAELVGDHAAVVVLLVHLGRAQAKDVVGRSAVTDHALRTTG